MALMNLDQVTIVADGLDHPECVTVGWDGTLWAGGELGQVYRIDAASGTFHEVASTGGFALGVTLDGSGYAYVCDLGKHNLARVNLASGEVETVVESVAGRPLSTPNYAVFDQAGRLYISDSGHWQQDDGFMFVLEPDGSTCIIAEEACHFPNGLALDWERNELYIAESTLPGVTKLDLATRKLETVAHLPGTVPDGLALDEQRRVYVGCYRPDAILRITDGQTETLLDDPQGTTIAAPTNLAFGGPDRRNLYIASLGRWHIGMVPVDVPGLALCYPKT